MDIYEYTQAFYQSVKTPKEIIGKSLFGHSMYAVKAGEGRPCGIAQYAIHGREYITAKLAFAQYEIGVKKGSCWFLPLVNPDGALLAERGLDSVENEKDKARLLALNNGSEDFSLWKANGRGVDLNVNFPARWGTGVKNTRTPSAENYIGEAPCSELETRALVRFTQIIRPDYTVSYHTKGEEIYWYFYQSTHTCHRDKALAETLSKATGYPLKEIKGSAGGYKDWCVKSLQIPAFTVEAGKDDFAHPLGEDALADILEKNLFSIYQLSKEL